MQPAGFKLYYAPSQGEKSDISPQKIASQKSVSLNAKTECGIWFQSFGTLFDEANSKETFYIARIKDKNKMAHFYEGDIARTWLSHSFRHPGTNGQIEKVQFFGFDHISRKGVKVFKQIFECNKQSELIKARGAMIERAEFKEKMNYLEQCLASKIIDEVERVIRLCMDDMRTMASDQLNAHGVEALSSFLDFLEKRPNYIELIKELIQIINNKNSNNTHVFSLMGKMHNTITETKQAVTWYERALAADPADKTALLPLCTIFLSKGLNNYHPHKAIEYYEKAYNHKEDQEILQLLFETCIPHDAQNAIQPLKKISERDPNNLWALLALGLTYKKLPFSWDFSIAAEYFEKALTLAPNNKQARIYLAKIYARGGSGIKKDPQKAMTYLGKVLSIDPKNKKALSTLPKIYRGEEGLNVFNNNPRAFEYCEMVVQHYQQSNHWSKVVKWLGRAWIHGNNQTAFREMVHVSIGANCPKYALPYIKKAIQEDPTNAIYIESTMQVYQKYGRPQKAIKRLEHVMTHNPTNVSLLFQIADFCLKNSYRPGTIGGLENRDPQSRTLGINALHRVLVHDPRHAPARQLLARELFYEGPSKGIAYYQRAAADEWKEAGCPHAALKLAFSHMTGTENVPKDVPRAVELLKQIYESPLVQSLNKLHPYLESACLTLAKIYMTGEEGVAQDLEQASLYCEEAIHANTNNQFRAASPATTAMLKKIHQMQQEKAE